MKQLDWLLPCICLSVVPFFAESALSCCSLAPATFSSTKGLAAEAVKDGKLVHLLAYQNIATNKNLKSGGNAMLLPIPAKPGTMSEKNVLNTSNAANILKDMERSLDSGLKGEPMRLSAGAAAPAPVQVFESDIYTIVLAADARQIPKALERVPAGKRPSMNQAIFDAYSKWYPGWTFALCCFNNQRARQAKPLLWWYEPIDKTTLFFPALDEHDGAVPALRSQVPVDHVVMFSVPQLKDETGHRVEYSDTLSDSLKSVLPKHVLGESYIGKMAQGDFQVSIENLRKGICNIERVLPPGLKEKSLGLASRLYTPGPAPQRLFVNEDPAPSFSTNILGNIAPYRRDLIIRLASTLKGSRLDAEGTAMPLFSITIAKDGKIVSSQMVQSGTEVNNKACSKAIESCKFQQLPDWFKGKQLIFKIDMDKARKLMKQN
ncbi:MAG: hypothetical protein K2X27_09460 [Candidatus Obscuribacterales bacterium]|nr:hypothetical protein [Candidatus Obscuribacterales bacterium]